MAHVKFGAEILRFCELGARGQHVPTEFGAEMLPVGSEGATCPYRKPIEFGVQKSLRSTYYCQLFEFGVQKS